MTLPSGIDLEQYKRQAKELLRGLRAGEERALARLRAHYPARDADAASSAAKLADAQLVIAREHDFPSWPKFREYLLFRHAVAALDAGDVRALETLLDAHPSILRYECHVGEWYERGYFAGATLLQHVAGNPIRAPLPSNILDVTRAIVARHFDKTAADATISLILTSKQAAASGQAIHLIDLLASRGARFDLHAPETIYAPLLNDAAATAHALARRRVQTNLQTAAAIGNIKDMLLRLNRPPSQLERDEALILTCISGQIEAAELLMRHGARGDELMSLGVELPRTALHEAANRGHLEIVRTLLAAGTRTDVVEPRWNGTAAGWAEAGGHAEIAALLDAAPKISP